MGKRKERRLAAMAPSRRFKLDLFADPSGDLSVQEGAKDNLDHDAETGVPNSPTSSGKQENPLSLLSQYTDEDSDEEEMERSSDATREGSVPNGQIAENTAESGEAENVIQEIAPATIEDLKHSDDQIDNVSKEVEATGSENLATENQITQSFSGEPVMQPISDVGGDWKAVVHAETNQCYYWNTITGETSWEVPAGLVSTVPTEVVASDSTTSIEAGIEASKLVEPGSLPLECQMSGPEDTGLPAKCHVAATEEDTRVSGGTAFSEDFDPDKLVEYGKDLLERLKLLDGSSTEIERIKEEIEIRTSDCKELKPYGMSLFPFWLHTQLKLRHLEASVCNAEASLSKSTPDIGEEEAETETYAAFSSFGSSRQMQENGGGEKEKEEEKEIEIEQEQEEKEKEKKQEETEKEEEEEEKDEEKEKEEIKEEETIPMDAIDDVEMEVEEENFETDVMNPDSEPPLPFLEDGEIPPPPSPVPDEGFPPPPPPPEDEPVPPPPEDELVPPPPPEEPSVSYSVVETIPPPYQNYMAVPTYSYSAPAVGYSQPQYYEAYYTVPAQVPAQEVHVTNGMVEPAVYNYAVPAVQGTAEISTELDGSLSMYHTGSYVGSTNEISVSSASQSAGSVNVAGDSLVAISSAAATSAAIPSAAATSSALPPAVTKDPIKVTKSKKRSIAGAPTLRSNKKVASLVDKWKAAKEELHGDYNDEPESAYDAIERKRQKEIEHWLSHHIASGEAQNNANFVPLGGDWRERVKRKRANKKAKMEDEPETPSDATTTTSTTVIENEKQQVQEQPELSQLSIGLPSGWQAYWDESSKQVYYGNAITSETTWVRPT